ncbi:LuxR C-terminal-related transcriptional regulator [Streptomyces sp. NPDC002926]
MTTLLERQAALDLLHTEAARARAGSGRLVLFRGPTGTGRSSLMEAAVDHGAQHGMRVLGAYCSAENSGAPFASVRKMLSPPGGFGSDDEIPQASHHRGYAARLWRLLCSYAADSPLLLTVDDVHLADPASRRWLTEAVRHMARLPILLVATERGQYDITPPSPGFAHGLPPARVRVHAPAPLSRAGAEAMVRATFGADTADAWLDGCVRAGAGSPLLLRALLDDLRAVVPDGGGAGSVLPESCADLYPGAFVAAVSWWLDSAGNETATVARALAELEDDAGPADGDDTSHGPESLLSGVTGAGATRVSGWVTAMIRLGLLRRDPVHGRPRFAHPLLREAVLDGWPQPRRNAVHRAAAEFRCRRGDRAEAVAGHLLRIPRVGLARAARTLLAAAADATRAGRTGNAVAYLRGALDEPLPRERRAAALVALGTLEFTTVRSAGIPRLAEALRLQDVPRERVLTAVTLGTALARRGEARAAFDVLRDLGGLREDPVLARTVQTASALLSDHDREIRREVYARLRHTAEQSPALLSPAVRALLLRYEATAGLVSAERAVRKLQILTAAPEDPLLVPYLLGTAAAVAQWADALDLADRLVRAGLADHRLSPLHPIHGPLINVRIDTAAARGEFAQVLAYASGQDLPPDVIGRGPSNFQANSVLALVRTDRLPEAHRLVDSVSVKDAEDSWEVNRFLYARGVLRAASGDPMGALEDFLECGRRQVGRDTVSPVVTPWRSAAAECQLTLGRVQAALVLAAEEHRLACVWGTPRVVGRALRVLGEATGGRRGLELTGQAVDILRETSLDTELGAALVSHGRQLTAAGQPRQARPLLREAAAAAHRVGATRLLTVAEQALRGSGARRGTTHLTGEGALTRSERRIAALAAEGRTNAEISELLHLARRTVETHLTSTYRKLGIRRRSELPRALNSDGPRNPVAGA